MNQLFAALLICFLTSFHYLAEAQVQNFKWGKFSEEETSLTEVSYDSEADIVSLGEKGNIRLEYENGLTYYYSCYGRRKVLKPSGIEKVDITVPYYHHNNLDRIVEMSAQIISPDGTKLKIKGSDMLEEVTNDYWSKKKIVFPNVQVGSIIEYSYTIQSSRFSYLHTWYFQRDYPILYSELDYYIPTNLQYVYLMEGRIALEKNDVKRIERNGRSYISGHVLAKDVPALEDESHVSTVENYIAKISFQLQNYINSQGYVEEVFSTWNVVGKELIESKSFGEQIYNDRYSKNLVAAAELIVQKEDDKLQMAKNLFLFVHSKIKSNPYKGIYSEDIDEVYEKAEGSNTAKTLSFLRLCQVYGITAYPVVLSTRDHGLITDLYSFLGQFNSVVAKVVVDNREFYIDFSSSFLAFGELSSKHLNFNGLQIYPDRAEIIEIPPSYGEDIIVTKINLQPSGEAHYNMIGVYRGLNAIEERRACSQEITSEHWLSRLGENLPDVEIKNHRPGKIDLHMNNFSDTLELEVATAGIINENLMYFKPIAYSGYSEPVFTKEKRKLPIEFSYYTGERLITEIIIPEGYKVDYLPPSKKLIVNGVNFTYSYLSTQSDQVIRINSILVLKESLIEVAKYDEVKTFFEEVAATINEQIVLVKI